MGGERNKSLERKRKMQFCEDVSEKSVAFPEIKNIYTKTAMKVTFTSTCNRNSLLGMSSCPENTPAPQLSSLEGQTLKCNQLGYCCFPDPLHSNGANRRKMRKSSVSHFVMFFLRKWMEGSSF